MFVCTRPAHVAGAIAVAVCLALSAPADAAPSSRSTHPSSRAHAAPHRASGAKHAASRAPHRSSARAAHRATHRPARRAEPHRGASHGAGARHAPRRAAAGSGLGGAASWYGPGFHGRRTASGQRFDADSLTAAHRTLPFGTAVKVTNRANGRSVVVTINDRGPFHGGRVIDLSRGAATRLGMTNSGIANVTLEVEGRRG